ncbi:ubiquitin-conjugating enzyme E2 S [Notamacropus eugenii]|uniref:ubiquitin-conjugating enzyme E2 S n=2 Tax=Diprotodontia TaxID=38609 RepID=UPI003B66BFF6
MAAVCRRLPPPLRRGPQRSGLAHAPELPRARVRDTAPLLPQGPRDGPGSNRPIGGARSPLRFDQPLPPPIHSRSSASFRAGTASHDLIGLSSLGDGLAPPPAPGPHWPTPAPPAGGRVPNGLRARGHEAAPGCACRRAHARRRTDVLTSLGRRGGSVLAHIKRRRCARGGLSAAGLLRGAGGWSRERARRRRLRRRTAGTGEARGGGGGRAGSRRRPRRKRRNRSPVYRAPGGGGPLPRLPQSRRPPRGGGLGEAAPGPGDMNSNVENLPPHIIRLVYKEVTTLTSDPPDGIKVFPNEEDLTDLQVTIEGPEGTPYAGGLFRMKLLLGKDFPAAPPKGFFLTKIFHPNVGANGEICVNVLKRDWTAELGIRHVLLTIKCLLIHPNPESALNEEAGRLLLEDYEEYAARARLLTEIHGGAGGPGAMRAARGGPGGAEAGPAEAGASSSSPPGPGAEGPMAKKHAGERDKKQAAKKKTDKKRALRRL